MCRRPSFRLLALLVVALLPALLLHRILQVLTYHRVQAACRLTRACFAGLVCTLVYVKALPRVHLYGAPVAVHQLSHKLYFLVLLQQAFVQSPDQYTLLVQSLAPGLDYLATIVVVYTTISLRLYSSLYNLLYSSRIFVFTLVYNSVVLHDDSLCRLWRYVRQHYAWLTCEFMQLYIE